ncbi:MAG: hypothetical protein GX457_13315, partial [Thermotogaceae bacterium]|nr:hypothetical protein [Thermotogaceae bacterium]
MNYDSLIMPAGSDYQAAIQHPDFCFKDEELASSSPIKNTNGLPSSASGRFAIVFPLKNHSKNLAVRCFTIFPKDQEKRYTLIDKALKQAKLPFFVDFTYKEEGIYLKNKWYPVLKMD